MKQYFSTIFNRPKFHNPVVDGIRGFSILLVVFGHLFHFHDSIFTLREDTDFLSSFSEFFRGDLGVDMFFVISGFLIGGILFKEYQKNSSISYKSFYFRRFLRLMPVYLIGLFLMWCLYNFWKGDGENFQIEVMMSNVWTNIIYINNFVPVEDQFMGWCWTLAVEEQFYFLVPIFIVFLLRKVKNKFNIFLALLILSSVIRFYIVYHYNLVGENYWGGGLDNNVDYWRKTFSLLYDNLYSRYGGLLIGLWGSYLYIFKVENIKFFFNRLKLSKNLYYLSIFVIVSVFIKLDYFYFIEFTSLGLEIGGENLSFIEKIYFSFIVAVGRNLFSLSIMYIIFYCMFHPSGIKSILNRFLSSNILFPIAQLSYSTYLIHPIVMIPVFRFFGEFLFSYTDNVFLVFIGNGIVSFILIFLLSLLLYVGIEKPFMKMRNSPLFKRISK